ncbi:MAG TPA: tetratricopeptide repeat protein [Actinomycetota bacterium]|nr:tetratricopeptide repeat protein [Actinomycetota bacterium]
MASRESPAERRVWALLTQDFSWAPPTGFPVQLVAVSDRPGGVFKLQVFEVAIARIFADLRPDYEWRVSPNYSDGGVDFVGRQQFLKVEYLTIDAGITVGGQCKKRTRVNKVLDDIAGSLISMAGEINPTFFVVAFSARVTQRRIDAARRDLERELRRHCHILDRRQIEALIHHHLPAVEEILRQALPDDVDEILAYFEREAEPRPSPWVEVTAPPRVLAGEPFAVAVEVRSPAVSAPGARLWWRPRSETGEVQRVRLIGPVGCDSPAGRPLAAGSATDDTIRVVHDLEFDSYNIGDLDLGEVIVGFEATGADSPLSRNALGRVRVVENLRPRFFEPPFRGIMKELDDAYERARAGAVVSFGIVGAGGSGKTRVSEAFCLEKRRRGAGVVAAKQAKTLNDPHRLVRDLLVALVPNDVSRVAPADDVLEAISCYDPALAARAAPAISAIFGARTGPPAADSDQVLLSALVLLMTARRRHAPLVVHLQDLHWTSNDGLVLLDRLVWQLSIPETGSSANGVFFLFEGRVKETYARGADVWTSAHFEAFLETLGCPVLTCSAFSPEQALEFIRLLFEDRHHRERLVEDDLLELQHDLIQLVNRKAGGNPFHSLQLLRLLKAEGVVGQNPDTGLLFMMLPLPPRVVLPESVYESVAARWEYLRREKFDVALLLWAAALLEDRVSMPLFRRLWSRLAPDFSLREIDATDILWTDEGAASHASFRHELYFETLRQFDVPPDHRERVVEAYSSWYEGTPNAGPLDLFRWGRVLLEKPERDAARASSLFDEALGRALAGGDDLLAHRIAVARLDLAWSIDDDAPVAREMFLRLCDDELVLTRQLLGRDRLQAARRLEALRRRIGARRAREPIGPTADLAAMRERELRAEVRRSQVLFNDRAPDEAAEVAGRIAEAVRAVRRGGAPADPLVWDTLEVEALHSQAVSLALSGEYDVALDLFERALDLARASASPLLLRVTSTYGNVMLARDPRAALKVLRECAQEVLAAPQHADLWSDVQLNLSLALIVVAYRTRTEEKSGAAAMLEEADMMMTRVFTESTRVGNDPDAGASAIVLGLLAALRGDESAPSWFAQGVSAAARGRQMETLWRAHVNLAISLHRRRGEVTPKVVNHAVAALGIMEETLARYSEPGVTARFRLLRIGLSHIARFLILAGDERGIALLERYPELRSAFEDPVAGVLREDRGTGPHHKWLRIGDGDYVLY